jgi:hypothetical protein
MEHPEYVDLEGHRVRADQLDRFYHGRDGSRVTDEEWDEEKRRREGRSSVSVIVSTTRPPDAVYDDEED